MIPRGTTTWIGFGKMEGDMTLKGKIESFHNNEMDKIVKILSEKYCILDAISDTLMTKIIGRMNR